MVLPKGPFWEHVEEMTDGFRMCKFCRHPFSNRTPITRFKFHWSGVEKRGTRICDKVPESVRKAALEAVDVGPPKKKLRTTSSSSSNSAGNGISTSLQQENIQVENAMTDDATSLASQLYSQRQLELCLDGNSVIQVIHPGPETCISGAPQTASGTKQVGQKSQRNACDISPLFMEDDVMENTTVGLMLHVEIGGSAERLSVNEDEPRGNSSQPTDPQEENDEVNNLARDEGQIQIEVQGTEQGVGEGRTSSLAEAGNLMDNITGEMMHIERSISAEELIVDVHGTRGEAPQEEVNNEVNNLAGDARRIQATSQEVGRNWAEIPLMGDDTENETGGVAQPDAEASSSRGLTHNRNDNKGYAPVGQAFNNNKKTIWSWLMNDEVSVIGIYGMGGVGKTTLMIDIRNQLRKRPDRHVYWVTVSQDFSINRLQNSIARRIGLDLSIEEEELDRADKLSEELMKRHKWVLILDDLWNSFELHKVGIPVQAKGCKVILTTRSEKVCQQMDSQKRIKVKPLFEEEAWTLFREKLGHDRALSPEVKEIAQSITKECDGLPLGIITMAGTMKGVDDIHEWRNALEGLQESRVRQDDMEEQGFRILKFSYVHLKDSTLQQCFLYCALFPEDFRIPREDLIGYLIDEGVIKGMKSRQAEFDKGHAMLNKLLNVCLLESGRISGDDFVKMHDLIRDMALQILQENSQMMVKAGAQLKELPDAEEWKENLVRVSLMKNQIREIPSSHSPRCPRLSTLLLSWNGLQFIADSFFKQLFGLKVLDLSCTFIKKLPDSISDLVSLNALLLQVCEKLRDVPSLKKLKTLKRLDLHRTALEKVPQGMECLANLRYLRLNGGVEKEFPSGILSKLFNLQVLIIENGVNAKYAFAVKGKEVACLRKLETLQCHFEHLSDFTEYLKSRDETQSLSTYRITVGDLVQFEYQLAKHWFSRHNTVGFCNLNINRHEDLQVVFPNDIEKLVIYRCNDAIGSLCDVSPLIKHATELEVINIWVCDSIESVVSSSLFCSAPPPSPSYYNGIFSSLKEFQCYYCRSMKKLFPAVLLPNLVNLEVIAVSHCEGMEEIIERSDEEGVMGEEFSLPKLRSLKLVDLPKLKSFCSAKLICDSLEEIRVLHCQKLKRMPICVPLLDNGQPSPPPSLRSIEIYPQEWWERVVEWEHPNAKDVLQPFVRLRHCDSWMGL